MCQNLYCPYKLALCCKGTNHCIPFFFLSGRPKSEFIKFGWDLNYSQVYSLSL